MKVSVSVVQYTACTSCKRTTTTKKISWFPSCLMFLFTYTWFRLEKTRSFKMIYFLCIENAHLGPTFICLVSPLFNRGCIYVTNDQSGLTVSMWEWKNKSKGLFLERSAYSHVRGLLFHVENHSRVLANQVSFFFFFPGLFSGKMPIMQFKTSQSPHLVFFLSFPNVLFFAFISLNNSVLIFPSVFISCPILGFWIHSLFPKYPVAYQRCNHIHSLNSRWLEADSA